MSAGCASRWCLSPVLVCASDPGQFVWHFRGEHRQQQHADHQQRPAGALRLLLRGAEERLWDATGRPQPHHSGWETPAATQTKTYRVLLHLKLNTSSIKEKERKLQSTYDYQIRSAKTFLSGSVGKIIPLILVVAALIVNFSFSLTVDILEMSKKVSQKHLVTVWLQVYKA